MMLYENNILCPARKINHLSPKSGVKPVYISINELNSAVTKTLPENENITKSEQLLDFSCFGKKRQPFR